METHRWQCEYVNATDVLTSRLRELAEFLDSLLKQKGVTSVIATDRRRAIRNAIDTSLDLSKTFYNLSQSINDTMNLSNFTVTESFLLSENKENIQNSCGVGTSILAAANESSLLKSRTEAVMKIGAKNELDKSTKKDRKVIIDPNSESEAWSEPDRTVSSARIGLEDLLINNAKCSITNSLELDSLNSTTDDDDNTATGKNNTQKNSAAIILSLQERIDVLQLQISERDNRILESQCKLVDTDNKYHEERLKILEMTKELNCYKNANDQLELEIAQTKVSNEKCLDDIEKLRHKLEKQQIEHKNDLYTNWISRGLYEKQKQTISDAEMQINMLKDNEAELNAQIIKMEKEMRRLRQCLDETTLQASKTVVDRHKMLSEKTSIEKKCNELAELNEKLQSQIHQLSSKENPTSSLLSVSTKSKYSLSKSASHGNARYMMSQFHTDLSPSDYTSADEMRYRFDNSSPDLGIDSDAGRTSGSEKYLKLNAIKIESDNNGKLYLN